MDGTVSLESTSTLDNEDRPSAQDQRSAAKRIGTACETCRRKRTRCDGKKPTCGSCKAVEIACLYNPSSDRRKPYTKDLVNALQLKIRNLERQVATLTAGAGDMTKQDDGTTASDREHIATKNAFQGALSFNALGQVRFYGPSSTFGSTIIIEDEARASGADLEEARKRARMRPPVPGALPLAPMPPRRPPELSPDLRNRLLRMAFDHCFAFCNLVPEREFLRDFEACANARTHYYSPLLLNVALAIGARYLREEDDFPRDLCGVPLDFSTRGDCFTHYARMCIDQEWYDPTLASIRALACLAILLAGRGINGAAWMYGGQAIRLCEDFGLHLGIHRLFSGSERVGPEMIKARTDVFYSAFTVDLSLAIQIGRSPMFSAVDIDHNLPSENDAGVEYMHPLHRPSAFHWTSKLAMIVTRLMNDIYSRNGKFSSTQRLDAVAELHLALESWHHQLPSQLRVTGSKGIIPPQHVITLAMYYQTAIILLHRPFVRKVVDETAQSLPITKCFAAARAIVKLLGTLRDTHTLKCAHPFIQYACFSAGTILAIGKTRHSSSAVQPHPQEDRRDLLAIHAALIEIGQVWTSAQCSASVLAALAFGVHEHERHLSQPNSPMSSMLDEINLRPALNQEFAAAEALDFLFPSWELRTSSDSYDYFLQLLSETSASAGL